MDVLSLGFLILIVAMSGGIAVLADDIGRRLGKRRLHVKGLRPKRVAQIGTALAGVIVSLLTIIVVASASSGVRRWIVEGRQAIRDRDNALKEVRDLQAKQIDLQNQNQSKERANLALQSKNEHLSGEAHRQQGEIKKQKRSIEEMNRQIGTLRPQMVALRVRVAQASEQARRKQQELDRNKKELVRRQNELAAINRKLITVGKKLTVALKENATAEAYKNQAVAEMNEAKGENDHLNAQKQQLEREIAQLNEDVATKVQQLKEAQTEVESAQKALGQTQMELNATIDDLNNAKLKAAGWMLINDVVRNAPVTFFKGDEVARLSLEPGLSVSRAQSALQSLLRNARLAALAVGAKPNGPYPEAGIFAHTDSITRKTLTPEDIEQEIVSKVAGAKDPLVLVAVSSFNAFKGEPVSLEVVWVPNPLVYRRDEVVAEARLDARKDVSVIVNEILTLGEKIKERARSDKMLPRATEELSNSLGQDQIWRLVNDIKKSGGFVKLRALAEGDIRAGDPLKVRFVLR